MRFTSDKPPSAEDEARARDMARDKIGQAKPPPSSSSQQADSGTSYSNYLFGRAGEGEKPLWSDSVKGRATIRLISRGIFGALAMTVVERSMRAKLMNYEPGSFNWGNSNTYTRIAYAFDRTFGRVIQKVVKLAGGTEAAVYNATRFRQKAYFHTEIGQQAGRSLGAEMVAVTAGFAVGSFGDATARNVIQVIDPNSKKSWLLNDKGEPAAAGEKKHFDFGKWAAATARSTWRILSKNMGEDWAVALPYVYQMRWQRNLIARKFSDAKLPFDAGDQGASLHLNDKGEIVGDFQIPGAIDLHARFVGYNWLTLMYRETYDTIGRGLKNWKDRGFALDVKLPENPITAALETVGYGARYVAKSFIKANIYMQPAVIPFWVMRVSQSRWRGSAILQNQHPDLNAIGGYQLHQPGEMMTSPSINGSGMRHNYSTTQYKYPIDAGVHLRPGDAAKYNTIKFAGGVTLDAAALQKPGSVFSWDMNKKLMDANFGAGLFSTLLTPFGWASYNAGTLATKLLDKLPASGRVSQFLSKTMINASAAPTYSAMGREIFTRNLVDNAFSYTPYMIAKTETALRVDERSTDGSLGEMDKAIYRFINSTVRFDLKNAGKAIKDIAHYATDMGREVKMREGGEVETRSTVVTPEDKPSSAVHAASVERKELAPADVAASATPKRRASDIAEQADKNWAESVTGRSLAGQFQPAAATVH